MSEYEKLLRDYVKLYNTWANCSSTQLRISLEQIMDDYFADTICEYSMDNKMSLEEIIGCQISTNFCYCRKDDFKELLDEFLDEFEESE